MRALLLPAIFRLKPATAFTAHMSLLSFLLRLPLSPPPPRSHHSHPLLLILLVALLFAMIQASANMAISFLVAGVHEYSEDKAKDLIERFQFELRTKRARCFTDHLSARL